MAKKSAGRPQHPGRIDVNINAEVRVRAAEEATRRGVSLNEVVNEHLARAYGLDPARHPVPRKAPGRPLGRPKKSEDPPKRGS